MAIKINEEVKLQNGIAITTGVVYSFKGKAQVNKQTDSNDNVTYITSGIASIYADESQYNAGNAICTQEFKISNNYFPNSNLASNLYAELVSELSCINYETI